MRRIRNACVCALMTLCILLTGCQSPANEPETVTITPAETVRAVWVPYMEVAALLECENPVEAIRACVRDCADRGINTIYFHVRANSDAYYDSTVYPSVNPQVDALAVALEEAHRLGLSLHAWVNPYRIGTDRERAQTADVFSYNDRWYYIPTAQSTHQLVVDGVRELVEHYEIDGVQFDDYFYPVGAVDATTPAVFEQTAYAAYCQAGGALSVGDWRRAAVDRLIAAVYAVCHSREGCVFGVSPASDLTQVHDAMYADVAKWAKTVGYLDYLCPQIYFGFRHETAPFLKELDKWAALSRHEGVSLLAGLALYKTGLKEDPYAGVGKTEWATGGDILARQLRAVEEAGFDGAALYSHLSFEADDTRDAAVVEREIASLKEEFETDKK